MIGVDPATIVPLAQIDAVADAPARFSAVAADWIEDAYGADRFEWAEHWHHAPYDLLAKVFSRDELVFLWHGCLFASKLDDHIQDHDPLVWKIQHALWRYGGGRDYKRFVACHNALARFAVDLPGFDVRLTHTRYINTAGWSEHGGDKLIYLDASFGVLLHYRGEHVMTIGFSPCAQGVLIAQVQLREKRGNRFLYKLPMPYLDFAIDLVARAFPDEALYLVTGESTTEAIRSAYGKNADKLSAETADRVERFYDQPLAAYDRTGELIYGSSDDRRVFARLRRFNVMCQEAA